MSRQDRGIIARLTAAEKDRLLRNIARKRIHWEQIPTEKLWWFGVGRAFDVRIPGHNIGRHPLAIREWWRVKKVWAVRKLT